MRSTLITSIACLSLVGCPSSPPSDPTLASTPAPAPAPMREPTKPAPVVPPERRPSAPASAPPVPEAPAAVDYTALAKALLDGSQAMYSCSKHQIAFAEAYQQEGSGAGLNIAFVGEDGKPGGEPLEVYAPEHDRAARLAAVLPGLVERLTTDAYIGLPRTEWPEGKPQVVPMKGLELAWRDHTLVATRAGEGSTTGTRKVRRQKPFTAHPVAVYVSMNAPVLIVSINHDPGSAYGEGFNVYTSHEVMPLPQVKSN